MKKSGSYGGARRRMAVTVGAAQLALLASSARAADLTPLPPPAPTSVDWSGPYVGAHVGGVFDGQKTHLFRSGPSGPGGGGGGGAAGGGVGGDGGDGANAQRLFGSLKTGIGAFSGLHAGYNIQSSAMVFGVEAGLSSYGRAGDLLGSARARLGWASGSALFYAFAGAALQTFDGGAQGRLVVGRLGGAGGQGGASGAIPGAPGGAGGAVAAGASVVAPSRSRGGVEFGAGVEMRASSRVSVGLEAATSHFGGSSLWTPRRVFALTGRVNYHFGAAGAATAAADWRGVYAGLDLGSAHAADSGSVGSVQTIVGRPGGAGTAGAGGGGGGGGGGGSGGVAFMPFRTRAALTGGLHAGYNWQSGALVYGVEADALFSGDRERSWLGSARARIGYASGDALFHVSAGPAWTRARWASAVAAGPGGAGAPGASAAAGSAGGAGGLGGVAFAAPRTRTQAGFVVGAGVEVQLDPRWSLGADASYWRFGRRATSVSDGVSTSMIDARGDAFTFRTRLTYRM